MSIPRSLSSWNRNHLREPRTLLAVLWLMLPFGSGQAAQTTVLRTNLNLHLNVAAPRTVTMAPLNVRTTALTALPVISRADFAAKTSSKLDPAKLNVFVREGTEWKRQISALAVSDRTVVPRIPVNATAVFTVPVTNKKVLRKGVTPLKFWLRARPQATDPYEEFEVEYYANPDPARWNQAFQEFETQLHIAIFGTNRTARVNLPSPVTVDLAGHGAEINPSQFTYRAAGDFENFKVSFTRNDVEASVNVFPFTEHAPLIVPVRRFGKIKASVTPRTILGYGLGTAQLTLKRVDTDGADLNEGPELNVDVESTLARFAESPVIPAGKSTTQLTLRSVGAQTDEITVSAQNQQETLKIQYTSPWWFLGAVVAGGLLGGCARCLQKKHWKNDQLARFLIEGCVAGILATAAVCAGVAFSILPAGVSQTELGGFLISAAVGLVGVAAISGLKNLIPKFGAPPSSAT
jgi:hypothetical protein